MFNNGTLDSLFNKETLTMSLFSLISLLTKEILPKIVSSIRYTDYIISTYSIRSSHLILYWVELLRKKLVCHLFASKFSNFSTNEHIMFHEVRFDWFIHSRSHIQPSNSNFGEFQEFWTLAILFIYVQVITKTTNNFHL